MAIPTPRGFYAPFQGAGIIWDVDPGWASFLGQPGAIGCHASGVGEWRAGNAVSFAVDVRGGVLVLLLVLGPMGVGEVVRGGLDSSTSTALRAEYEYERESRPRSSANPGLSAVTPSALESGRPGMRVPSPWMCEGGYSYSYSSRWDQGMESRVGRGGSSTSTALRAEYEYEYERESRRHFSANPELSAATPLALGMGLGMGNRWFQDSSFQNWQLRTGIWQLP